MQQKEERIRMMGPGKGNKMFIVLLSCLYQESIKNAAFDGREWSICFACSDKEKLGSNVVGKDAGLSE